MAGWQGQFSYSIGGGATGTEGTPKSNSAVSSGAIFFMSGPIYFGAAFQYNEQVRAAGLNDIAYSIAGAYQFPKVRVGAVYERLDYDCQGFASGPVVNPLTPAQIAAACISSPTTFGTSSLTRNMYGVDLTIDIGPGQLYADWSYGDNGKGSAPNGARVAGLAKGDNSSSNQWEVSYTYPLSKRTSLYTGYTQIVNKSRRVVQLQRQLVPDRDRRQAARLRDGYVAQLLRVTDTLPALRRERTSDGRLRAPVFSRLGVRNAHVQGAEPGVIVPR